MKNGKLQGVIVSLTTYGKRIESVYKTIESIWLQSTKPEFVVLWLSETEFTLSELPETLKKFDKDFLKIRFCEDCRSYTKLVPSIQEYPEKTIITIDDDYIYPSNLIERLVEEHKAKPTHVVCARARIIKFSVNDFESYHDWTLLNYKCNISAHFCLLPLGYAGVLYPPKSLSKDATDSNIFLSLAPHADDLWFKCMGLLNETPVTVLSSDLTDGLVTIEGTQDVGLHVTHNLGEGNTNQMRALISKYTNLESVFKKTGYYDVVISGLELTRLNRLLALGQLAHDSFPVFRDSSISLKESSPFLSKRLHNLAKRIRPYAPFFRSKADKHGN